MSALGVVIIGGGRAGAAHARAVADTPGTSLVAIADVDETRAQAFAEAHGCLAFTDYRQALERADVAVAIIALPNFLHESATIAAASAGKHVFLEKPMADTLEECDRMTAAVDKAGVHLLVGQLTW